MSQDLASWHSYPSIFALGHKAVAERQFGEPEASAPERVGGVGADSPWRGA